MTGSVKETLTASVGLKLDTTSGTIWAVEKAVVTLLNCGMAVCPYAHGKSSAMETIVQIILVRTIHQLHRIVALGFYKGKKYVMG